MTAERRRQAGYTAMTPDIVDQVLRDYDALRRPDADPELEAVRIAIFLEDAFEVTLSDADIDPAVLADAPALAALVARLGGTA
jgi:hypothetical protein